MKKDLSKEELKRWLRWCVILLAALAVFLVWMFLQLGKFKGIVQGEYVTLEECRAMYDVAQYSVRP